MRIGSPTRTWWVIAILHLILGFSWMRYRAIVAWPFAKLWLAVVDALSGGPASSEKEILGQILELGLRVDNTAKVVVLMEFLVLLAAAGLLSRRASNSY